MIAFCLALGFVFGLFVGLILRLASFETGYLPPVPAVILPPRVAA